jgi:hypothetical protein
MLQAWLTALIVVACAAYVGWTLLLPAALRRRLATALLRRRWPAAIQRRLQAAAKASSGSGCDGCGASAAKPPAVQPVHWAPRRKL